MKKKLNKTKTIHNKKIGQIYNKMIEMNQIDLFSRVRMCTHTHTHIHTHHMNFTQS